METPKNVIELISKHETEIMNLPDENSRARRLLDMLEGHLERCRNINLLDAASDEEKTQKAINDLELLNGLPIPVFFLRSFIENGKADGGGKTIEKIKEVIGIH